MTEAQKVKLVVSPSDNHSLVADYTEDNLDVAENSEKVEIGLATVVDIGLMLTMIRIGIFNTRGRSKSDVFNII